MEVEKLRSEYPHGHPEFIPLALEEIRLHSDKNHDYASGGPPLGNFERAAAILKLYPDFPYDTPEGWAMLHVIKQLDAVLWGLSRRITHKVEGLESRLGDISVYAKIVRCILRGTGRIKPKILGRLSGLQGIGMSGSPFNQETYEEVHRGQK